MTHHTSLWLIRGQLKPGLPLDPTLPEQHHCRSPRAPAVAFWRDSLIDFLVEPQITRRRTHTHSSLARSGDPFTFFCRPVLQLARRNMERDVLGFTTVQVNTIE